MASTSQKSIICFRENKTPAVHLKLSNLEKNKNKNTKSQQTPEARTVWLPPSELQLITLQKKQAASMKHTLN